MNSGLLFGHLDGGYGGAPQGADEISEKSKDSWSSLKRAAFMTFYRVTKPSTTHAAFIVAATICWLQVGGRSFLGPDAERP
jgi:hypothetical protein